VSRPQWILGGYLLTLATHGYAERVADAVVVCCDRVSPEIDRERVRAHFLGRLRAVVEIPYDPHLTTGGRLDLRAMLV
jgi:hypothetical protein